jgi:NADPH:quinone reductase-like Zn-dependent oxidoreductase
MRLGDLPDPSPRLGEVLVAVRASSVNPVDWKVRQGQARIVSGRRFPRVLGTDFAGVVVSAGRGAGGLSAGDSVYGYTPIMFGAPGAHAERLAVDPKRLRRIPAGLSFEEAASLPVAALTALNGLRKCGELRGKAVLVNGATGGVGHFAVQVARAQGARVTAVCSAGNAGRALALGAEDVLDYRAQDVTRLGRRWDILFDAHGTLDAAAAARLLPRGAPHASTLAGPSLMLHSLWARLGGGPRLVLANLRARTEDYAELERLLADGSVRPIVERVVQLDRAAEAFAAVEAGGVVGKVVIRVA